MTQAAATQAATNHISTNGPAILREFRDLLSLPNVSANLTDIAVVANHVAGMLQRRGIEPRILRIDGVSPVVSGRIQIGEGHPTIGIYAHYDGQPVEPEDWNTPPFEPTLVADGETVPFPLDSEPIDDDSRIFARSAADDKAPIVAFLTAVDALISAGIQQSVNIVLLFEGEEEAGSNHLANYLEQDPDWFAADIWLICDGPVHQSGLPQVIFGVRGIAEIDLTVYGPVRALHSGHYGNWVPNPTWSLVHLLSSMRDEQGNVLIADFYRDVLPPTPADLDAIHNLPPYEEGLLQELGVRTAEGSGESLVERMFRPSLNIRGFDAGGVGDKAANVVPEQATASIDIRLPPDHDPDEMLDRVEAHIASKGYRIVHEPPSHEERLADDKIVLVNRTPNYSGLRLPLGTQEAVALLASAKAASDNDRVVAMPTLGGSVPIVHFRDALGSPTIILPMANHDNNQHASNENIRVANLWYGVRLMAALLTMDYLASRT